MTTPIENVSLVRANAPELPAAVVRRGISEAQWRTLFNLFPGAAPDSALMVWDYCAARKLDPLKKPCHIVPMKVKQGGEWVWRDVVMPGIYEYRITAQRTGLYLGHTEPEFGPEIEHLGVKAPAWCAMTFYRWNEKISDRVPYPVKVWFTEVVGTRERKVGNEFVEQVNDRWQKAPRQMLLKCTEAAGLRETFPEEFGGETTAEEMDGQRPVSGGDVPVVTSSTLPKPAQRIQGTEAVVESAAVADAAVVTEPVDVKAEPAAEQKPEPTKTDERPAHIGRITDVQERGPARFVVLDTGFVAGTQDKQVITDVTDAREMGAIVELVTKAPSDPKFRPTLLEVKPRLDLMEAGQ